MPSSSDVIPVRVAVRVRPFVPKETEAAAVYCTECFESENQISIGSKLFTFSYVFDPSTLQETVYDVVAHPLTDNLFKGYNCTVFAYGQTGSGKTYTMGTEETEQTCGSRSAGIIPRIISSIFSRIEEDSKDFSFALRCSMLEIYEEKVIDLFADTRDKLELREQTGGVFVQGLTEKLVESLPETMKQLERGCQLRSKAETSMNSKSSRSHAIFTLFLHKTDLNDESNSCMAKLHLVDLAGSERLAKTQAEGQRMKEGIKINSGLLALGNVISALAENQSYVSYRDSKLTRMLQDSLGGNSYTVMIACVSPADCNFEETMSTLRYAERAMKIKNKPIVNRDPKAAEIATLRLQVKKLEHDLLLYQSGKEPAQVTPSALSAAEFEELKRLRKEKQELMSEKQKLTEQLAETTAEKLKFIELTLTKEHEKDKLEERNRRAAEQLGEVISIGASETLSENEKTAALRTLREILSELKADPSAEDDFVVESRNDLEVSCIGDESDQDDDAMGYQEKFVKKQSWVSQQIEGLMRQIQDKEKRVACAVSSQEDMEKVRQEHEKQMAELQQKIGDLEAERNRLCQEVKKKDNQAKMAEERRRKLAETEKQLQEYRLKLQDLKKLEKLKVQGDQNIKTLREEITGLKGLRVKLVRQLRQESERYRQWKLGFEREMNQMKQKERKREFEAQRTKQKYDQNLNVYKRKYEEAVSFGKRLKQQIETQKTAGQSRFDGTQVNENILKQFRNFLERELNAVASCEEAKIHSNNLVQQRKELNQQLKKAQKKLEGLRNKDEPPRKKMSMGGGRSSESDDSHEQLMAELVTEIKDLKTEMELRSSEINSIQSEITSFDIEAKDKQRWSNVHTLSHAKCYLKELFALAVNGRTDMFSKDQESQELMSAKERVDRSLKKTKTQFALYKRRVEQQHSALVETIDKEKADHQNMMYFMLKQVTLLFQGQNLSEEDMRNLMVVTSELQNQEDLHQLLAEQEKENKELQHALNRARVSGKKQFFKPIIEHSSVTPEDQPEEQMQPVGFKRSRSSRLIIPPKRLGQLKDTRAVIPSDSEEENSGWSEEDESYHETPLAKRVNKIQRDLTEKRLGSDALFGSSSGCRCKTDCKTVRCGCRKQNSYCEKACSCKEKCRNRKADSGTDEQRSSVSSSGSTVDSFVDERAPANVTFVASRTSDSSPINEETYVTRRVGSSLEEVKRKFGDSPLGEGLGTFRLRHQQAGRRFFTPVSQGKDF